MTKSPYFQFLTWLAKNKNQEFRLYGRLYGHVYILKSQNKITDFFMILAWASPFDYQHVITSQPISELKTDLSLLT